MNMISFSKGRAWLKRTALSLFYFGWNHYCPICKMSFREWLDCGLVLRRKGKCPQCSSAERHRLIYLYLKNKTNFFRSSLKVLHVAPEPCFLRIFKKMKNLEYQTADLESPYADLKIDITDMSRIPDNTYDVVLCFHVLEHIPEDLKAIREMNRVLKPDGWAILQVPIKKGTKTFEDPSVLSPAMRRKLFGQEDHVRVYGDDYKDRLESSGFITKLEPFARHLGETKIKQYGVPASEDIFHCFKRGCVKIQKSDKLIPTDRKSNVR